MGFPSASFAFNMVLPRSFCPVVSPDTFLSGFSFHFPFSSIAIGVGLDSQ